jgi:hypothetical protein
MMKSKMMAGGGMMKKSTASGGASKMGKVKTSSKPDGVIKKGATKGTMIKMAEGGMPMVMKDGKKVPAFAADGKGKMAKGGMAKMMAGGGMMKSKMMRSGGKAC